MCGFAGIASPQGLREIAKSELSVMLAPIAYRGPDDEAFEARAGFGVGFRRLAIVDVERGRQPMLGGDGRFTLACNGEIYNHRDLRRELGARGCVFQTESDSEVVLHAYAEWGREAVRRLRGIFAFALWDARERTLFLARDRSGIKPLVVCRRGDELHFASEAKALLAHPSAVRRLDLLGCFAEAAPDADFAATPFEGLVEIAPGTTLTFDPSGESSHRYWSYTPTTAPDAQGDDADDIARFRQEIDRVVEMQLMSDVPLGACLSGGLDSSLVAALASAHTPHLQTFTSVVAGSLDPWYAFVLSRSRGLESRFVGFDPERSIDELPLAAWGAEGMIDLGFVARLELAKSARERGIRVLLSGQGLDELVGGYDESPSAMARAATRSAAARRLLHASHPEIATLLSEPASPPTSETAHAVADHLARQHASLARYLLRYEDRMGMLAGVEVRVPFLDHEIVELCARVSPERRERLFGDKRLVREAARGTLPEMIRTRRKFAFNGNLPSIARALDTAKSPLARLSSEEVTKEKGYFDPARVRYLRETRDERLLDVVIGVHLLDELFVSGFDPARFAKASVPLPPEVRVDETFMPAEAMLYAATRTLRSVDVPAPNAEVTFVGRLHALGDGARGPELLVVRTTDGESVVVRLPPEIDPERALAFLRAVDGRRTYAELASFLREPDAQALAMGAFFAEQGFLVPVTRR